MATAVSEETLSKQIHNLIALDFDAIEAYQAALERLDDNESKTRLAGFKADHERHTEALGAHLSAMGETPPTKGDLKSLLTKGKVVIAGLAGDKAILQAMKSNEEDTVGAYAEATAQAGFPAALAQTLDENLADEKRHREWIERRIDQL